MYPYNKSSSFTRLAELIVIVDILNKLVQQQNSKKNINKSTVSHCQVSIFISTIVKHNNLLLIRINDTTKKKKRNVIKSIIVKSFDLGIWLVDSVCDTEQ